MRPGDHHSFLWGLLGFVQFASIAGLFFVLIAPLIREDCVPPLGLGVRNYLRETDDPWDAALTVLIGAIAILKSWIGPPKMWKLINRILHDFQKVSFNELPNGESSENHRITLYRHYGWLIRFRHKGKFCFPNEGWLVPVARAGTARKASTIYRASCSSNAEGVFGKAFFSQSAMHTYPPAGVTLPEVTSTSNKTIRRTYGELTGISLKEVDSRLAKNRPLARSFLSYTLEISDKKWGVVMIDSTATSMPRPDVIQPQFEQLKDTIRRILEG